jgi:hypothetical protein
MKDETKRRQTPQGEAAKPEPSGSAAGYPKCLSDEELDRRITEETADVKARREQARSLRFQAGQKDQEGDLAAKRLYCFSYERELRSLNSLARKTEPRTDEDRQRHEEAKQRRQHENEKQEEFQAVIRPKLKGWGELAAEDLKPLQDIVKELRSKADKELRRDVFQAATVYEYARESRKIRGLALAMHIRPSLDILAKKGDFVVKTKKGVIVKQKALVYEPLLVEAAGLCRFDGLTEYEAEKALGPWLYFLARLGDLLAENEPFCTIWSKRRKRFEDALWPSNAGRKTRPRDGRMELGYFFQEPGFGMAPRLLLEPATAYEDLMGKKRFRPGLEENGVETLIVRVNWADFRDEELGAAFEDYAKNRRPKRKHPGPLKKQGTGQVLSQSSNFQFLVQMRRVWCFPRSELAGEHIDGIGTAYGAAKKARELFSKLLPFDSPEHRETCAARIKKAKTGAKPVAHKQRRRSREWQPPEHWDV